ncbi:hypothetical protein RyT2_20690 [Pseudolactococcus yaeyamensis]
MFQVKSPKFNTGRILKKEMLEALKNYPIKLVETVYDQYQDGIIDGFDITIDADNIVVSSGVLKYDTDILVMDNSVKIPYTATEKVTFLKIKLLPVVEDEDFYAREATIVLSTNPQLDDNEWELLRFKLKEGAYLRTDYQDFSDLITEYNTVNFLHQERSLKSGQALAPVLIKQFCQAVEALGTTHTLDQAFCLQTHMSQNLVEKRAVEYYIATRLSLPTKSLSALEIHEKLGQILLEIKHDKQEKGSQRQRSRRMIVD